MSVVTLPWTAPPLTQNGLRRMHFQAEAKAKATALAEARWAVKAARLAFMPGAVVILNWQQPDKRRRDGDGAAPTLKVCLDALVQEGVLHDDSWIEVPHSGVTCHPPINGQPGALWLTLSDPDAVADALVEVAHDVDVLEQLSDAISPSYVYVPVSGPGDPPAGTNLLGLGPLEQHLRTGGRAGDYVEQQPQAEVHRPRLRQLTDRLWLDVDEIVGIETRVGDKVLADPAVVLTELREQVLADMCRGERA